MNNKYKMNYFTGEFCVACKRHLPLVQQFCEDNNFDLEVIDIMHTLYSLDGRINSLPYIELINKDTKQVSTESTDFTLNGLTQAFKTLLESEKK